MVVTYTFDTENPEHFRELHRIQKVDDFAGALSTLDLYMQKLKHAVNPTVDEVKTEFYAILSEYGIDIDSDL